MNSHLQLLLSPSHTSILLNTFLLLLLASHSSATDRRILHQPLYPETDPPPPPSQTTPYPNPDIPFTPEVPISDQTLTPPSPLSPPIIDNGGVPIPAAAKPTKKVAIVISVGIVSLGMLSALIFFLFRHRAKQSSDTQKLVGAEPTRTTPVHPPPSNFLYIGTVEPSSRRFTAVQEDEENAANHSPYHKLTSAEKFSSRYRPSPELQPLPPLVKPLGKRHSRSAISVSSEDEDSWETSFYTPNGSSSDTPVYNKNLPSLLKPGRINDENGNRHAADATLVVPRSRRTSPKSQLRQASPPQQPPSPAMIPSIKALSSLGQPVEDKSHQRPKFSAPPPQPNLVLIPALSHKQESPSPKTSIPPPPPPPPPPPLVSVSNRSLQQTEAHVSLKAYQPPQKVLKQQPETPISTSEPSVKQENRKETNSIERQDSDDMEGGKTKLKPLHWDKVRAISHRETVWDQLKSSSFQVNEDMMENLFSCNSASSAPKEAARRTVVAPAADQEQKVLDPKKSQNIAILLRALNVTRDEVVEALLDGSEGLGAELYETLAKMAPTREEEIKLVSYIGDVSKLGAAERFLKAVLDVPFAFKRIEALLYRANFDTEVNYLRNSFQTLEAASEELKSSRLFFRLLEAVLMTGNRMNVGTNRGDAVAFKLDTLLKLVDVKGTDGKTTLLHFVVQQIVGSEGITSDPSSENINATLKEEDFRKQGLQVVAGLSRDLKNVTKAAGMDSDVLSSYLLKLELGLDKVRLVYQYEKTSINDKFFESLRPFLKNAEDEIIRIKADEKRALSLVKEVTEYFHGDTTKEEPHPLRIFMIVRDFLSVLDHVCKEVGHMKNYTVVGAARSFRISSTASLPVLSRFNIRQDRSSDDE
ncbi:unnamed protein product [Rhodiola kirilowii]